jgi:hypothetical protein
MEQSVSWKQLVVDALRYLGGAASLKDITAVVGTNPARPDTRTWDATIRRVVRQYNIFEPFRTQNGLAGYRLIEIPKPGPKGSGKDDPHGAQQAMLLTLGSILGYDTFTNQTDRTIRKFRGESISKFATVRNDSEGLSALPLEKMRTTDVMWLSQDSEGLYPKFAFEVEHSTKVKSGMDRLQRIPARFNAKLCVVGSGNEEKSLFERYLLESSFRPLKQRFRFFYYDEVRKFYESGVAFDMHRKDWAVPFNSP